MQFQELWEADGAGTLIGAAAGSDPQPPQAGASPRSALTEPTGMPRASAPRPTMRRKARRSSPRDTSQHDAAHKGIFLRYLGAPTQLLPFKGSDCLRGGQPDQQSPFASLCEPSLDVISSSEPFIHLYLSWDPPRLFNFRAKSRLIQQQ